MTVYMLHKGRIEVKHTVCTSFSFLRFVRLALQAVVVVGRW